MHAFTESPRHDAAAPRIRRKRLRHAWMEASNPQDVLAARAGWATAALVLLGALWLMARNAGWI
jgi:hypothetical protein